MSKLVRSVLPQFKRSDLKDSFCIIPYSFKKLEWEKNLITTLAQRYIAPSAGILKHCCYIPFQTTFVLKYAFLQYERLLWSNVLGNSPNYLGPGGPIRGESIQPSEEFVIFLTPMRRLKSRATSIPTSSFYPQSRSISRDTAEIFQ